MELAVVTTRLVLLRPQQQLWIQQGKRFRLYFGKLPLQVLYLIVRCKGKGHSQQRVSPAAPLEDDVPTQVGVAAWVVDVVVALKCLPAFYLLLSHRIIILVIIPTIHIYLDISYEVPIIFS